MEVSNAFALAAQGWVSDKSTGVNQLAQFTKVNVMYISHILRSDFTYKDSKTGESKDIADRWFQQLADCIGLKLQKEYWPHVDTPQFKEIDLELREALAALDSIAERESVSTSVAPLSTAIAP